jgi:DNA polymerase Ligase (LigD)
MNDILKSWRVPKTLPNKKSGTWVATASDDLPVEDIDFEGATSKDARIWDKGTYDLIEGNYANGLLRFYLAGKKMKGEWTLRRKDNAARDKWQLTKT